MGDFVTTVVLTVAAVLLGATLVCVFAHCWRQILNWAGSRSRSRSRSRGQARAEENPNREEKEEKGVRGDEAVPGIGKTWPEEKEAWHCCGAEHELPSLRYEPIYAFPALGPICGDDNGYAPDEAIRDNDSLFMTVPSSRGVEPEACSRTADNGPGPGPGLDLDPPGPSPADTREFWRRQATANYGTVSWPVEQEDELECFPSISDHVDFW